MEAKELMIGDLVEYMGWIDKVTEVHDSKMIRLRGTKFLSKRPYDVGFLNASAVSPVPLTVEILEKNGWKLTETNNVFSQYATHTDNAFLEVMMCDNRYILSVEVDINVNGNSAVNSAHKVGNYVHELQHALRLCGLADIADNIKL